MGLQEDLETGEFRAIDRIPTDTLRKIRSPTHSSDEFPRLDFDQPPTLFEEDDPYLEIDLEVITEGLVAEKETKAPSNPLLVVPPHAAMHYLSDWHFNHFSADMSALVLGVVREHLRDPEAKIEPEALDKVFQDPYAFLRAQFIQLKYHVGEPYSMFELHSEPFPVNVDSWRRMSTSIVDHIEKCLDMDDPEQRKVPFRMIFFHNPEHHTPPAFPEGDDEGLDPKNILMAPMSFATWLRLSASEFMDYTAFTEGREGPVPDELRLGFDARYLYSGDTADLARSFTYQKHWEFYKTVCQGFASMVSTKDRKRELSDDILPFRVMDAHRQPSIPQRVFRHMEKVPHPRSTIYNPSVEMIISPHDTRFVFKDDIGLLWTLYDDADLRDSDGLDFRLDGDREGNKYVLIRKGC